jgi:hypothetical protein
VCTTKTKTNRRLFEMEFDFDHVLDDELIDWIDDEFRIE